ncbi:kinase-like domain-containing protein [Rhizophagus clarus]|nr:kinase-like domain-containing protein [Rhizophagus clarus]
MDFINAPIGNNNPTTGFHPQACYTSRLLDFTSKKVNEVLEDCIVDDNSDENLDEIVESECLDYIVDNIKSLDIKTR